MVINVINVIKSDLHFSLVSSHFLTSPQCWTDKQSLCNCLTAHSTLSLTTTAPSSLTHSHSHESMHMHIRCSDPILSPRWCVPTAEHDDQSTTQMRCLSKYERACCCDLCSFNITNHPSSEIPVFQVSIL